MAEPLFDYALEINVPAEQIAGVKTAFDGFRDQFTGLDQVSRAFNVGARREFADTFARLYALQLSGKIGWQQFGQAAGQAILAALAKTKEQEAENKRLEESQKRLAEAAQATAERHRILGDAFSRSSGFVLGWVRSGLQGTAEAEMMSLQFQRLSREIASVFAPQIRGVIDGVTRAAQWFRNLSGEQQASIRNWTLVGLGMLGTLTYLPKLTVGFQALGLVLKAALTGNPFLVLATTIGGALASTEKGRDVLIDLAKAMQPILSLAAEVARAFASVLAPAVQALADFLDSTTGKWTLAVIAAGAFVSYIPVIVGAVAGLTAAFKALTLAKIAALAFSGPVGWALLGAGAVALGTAAHLAGGGAEPGIAPGASTGGSNSAFGGRPASVAELEAAAARREGRAPPSQPRQELTPRGGGMEDVKAIFSRLQTASNRADPMVSQQEITNRHLARIEANTAPGGQPQGGNLPAVGQ